MASRPDRFLFPQPNNSTCLDGIFLCPPPVPPSSYDPSTTIHFRHSSLLPALPAAAASLVAAATLSLLLALFLLRRRRRRRHGGNAALDDPSADEPLEEQQGGGDDGEVEHHVWYIRTVGLDESTIRAITAWAYKAGDGVLGASAADCAVCLSEFRDGELVRLLPKCGHTFHLSCIDTWLRSHVNCPLCRAPVAAPISAVNNGGSETRTPSSSSSSSLSSTSSSSLSSRELAVDHVDPNSVSSALGDSNQINAQQIEAGQGALQEEMEGERLELGARSRTVVDSIPISELQVAIDIGEDGFQPIRRSVSMDSYACAPSMHRLESEEGQSDNKKEPTSEEERHNRTRGKQGNASSITSLHKERSSTSASGRFFLSRHGRAWSSVLPL